MLTAYMLIMSMPVAFNAINPSLFGMDCFRLGFWDLNINFRRQKENGEIKCVCR